MPDYSATAALMSDIEARQDDLLRQLDELEKRIARVLAEYAASCQPATGSGAGSPATSGSGAVPAEASKAA